MPYKALIFPFSRCPPISAITLLRSCPSASPGFVLLPFLLSAILLDSIILVSLHPHSPATPSCCTLTPESPLTHTMHLSLYPRDKSHTIILPLTPLLILPPCVSPLSFNLSSYRLHFGREMLVLGGTGFLFSTLVGTSSRPPATRLNKKPYK